MKIFLLVLDSALALMNVLIIKVVRDAAEARRPISTLE